MNTRTILSNKISNAGTWNSTPQKSKANSSKHTNLALNHILFLQRTTGNHVIERLLKSGVVQAKLTIGQKDDVYEKEADRIAEQAVSMRGPSISTAQGISNNRFASSIQRICTECEEELQR